MCEHDFLFLSDCVTNFMSLTRQLHTTMQFDNLHYVCTDTKRSHFLTSSSPATCIPRRCCFTRSCHGCQPETLPGIPEFRATTELWANFPLCRSGSAGIAWRALGMAEAAGAPCGTVQAMNRGMSSPGIITETDVTYNNIQSKIAC